MFGIKKKRIVKNFNLQQLKRITRILFIDDEDRSKTIQYLKSENWNARQIFDLESMENTNLIDSHIIYIDIMGVGKQMGKLNEGLDLIVSIKNKYPEKKVVVYSSKSTHDLFHEANDLVDKRILKRAGDFEVFRTTAEELSKKCFNWDFVIAEIFKKIEGELPENYDKNILENSLLKVIGFNGTIKQEKFQRILRVGKTTYDLVIPILCLYLGK